MDADQLELQVESRKAGAPPVDVLEFEVPSSSEKVYDMRTRVAEFASRMPFTADDIDDIKLAVGEAGANALRHGISPTCCRVGIRAERLNDAIRIFVIDKGCGFDPKSVTRPSLTRFTETGRGIMFMRAVMDEVKFHTGPLGTRVEMIKRFPLQTLAATADDRSEA